MESTERLAIVETEVKNVKDTVNRIEIKLNELGSNYAAQKDVLDLESRVVKLETRRVVKDTLVWVGLVASVLLNLFALYSVLDR
jgi:archaellum component FlaC